MTERTLAVPLATAAVTLSVTSSLIGLYRADGAERDEDCTPGQDCVATAAGDQVPIGEFEASCTSSTSRTDLRAYAHARSAAHDWSRAEHRHLVRLWTRESNWRWNATNPTSGAYGIPQSLPAKKLSGAGSDWKTNPCTQIRWGLSYIRDRYDSPAKAWAFWTKNRWY